MALRRDELAHGRQRLAHQAICQVKAKSRRLRQLKTLLCQRKGSRNLAAMEANIPQTSKNAQSLRGEGRVIHKFVGPLEDILTFCAPVAVDRHHRRTDRYQKQEFQARSSMRRN